MFRYEPSSLPRTSSSTLLSLCLSILSSGRTRLRLRVMMGLKCNQMSWLEKILLGFSDTAGTYGATMLLRLLLSLSGVPVCFYGSLWWFYEGPVRIATAFLVPPSCVCVPFLSLLHLREHFLPRDSGFWSPRVCAPVGGGSPRTGPGLCVRVYEMVWLQFCTVGGRKDGIFILGPSEARLVAKYLW